EIDLKTLVLESGKMNDWAWMHESTRHFAVERDESELGDLAFQLVDVENNLHIQVAMSPIESKLQVRVDDLLLDSSIIDHMPQAVRIWCEETEFAGNVKDIVVSWDPSKGINLGASVKGINFILPEQYSPPWAHYKEGEILKMKGKASLAVATGQIEFDGSSVAMRNIQGALSPPEHESDTPLPFSGEIEISGLASIVDTPSGEWMKDVVANAPFHARFAIEAVEPQKEESGAVELPLAVARALKTFQLEGWNVNAKVDMTRSSFGGAVEVDGALLINGDVGTYAGFPYPLKNIQSQITFHQDGVKSGNEQELANSKSMVYMSFDGIGGGNGELVGSVLSVEDGIVIPDIQLTVRNERITPALAETISIVSGDAYETVLGVLGGIGLEAELDLVGTILGDIQGDTETHFTVRIDDGISTPNEKLATAIHASGPFWPEGFQFKDVDGTITIDNGVVVMDKASFLCKTGSLEVSLLVKEGEFKLELECASLPINASFVDLLPNNVSGKLADAWNRLDPNGLIDAEIFIGRENGKVSRRMRMVPRILTVSGKGKSVDLEYMRGSVVVDNLNVHFDELGFQLEANGEPQGIVQLYGDVRGSKDDFHFNVDASWKAGAADSPLVRAICGMVSGESGVENFDVLEPSGFASASLSAVGDSEQLTYEVDIIPSMLSTTFDGRRAVAVFEQDAGLNTIHFNNAGIQFRGLRGKLGEGLFSLDGEVKTDQRIDGEFDLTWDGPSGDSSLFAVLPVVVGDTLDVIGLRDGKSVLPDGRVYFSGKSWSDIGVSFAGNISLSDVSIKIGIPMKHIAGAAYVDCEYDKDRLSEFEFVLNVESMSALGRNVTDIGGHLRLDADSQRIVFEEMRGESTTGSVSVDGWLAIDKTSLYEVEVLVAGVDLKTETNEDALASLEGELTGWISMAGVRGDTNSRRGLGLLKVQNGQFSADPVSLTAMQVLQLALPSTSSITGADIGLFIDGDRMILDEINLTSNNRPSDLKLEGEGTVDTDTFILSARLHPRAGFPIIRDIAGAINDQLYSVDITGELFNPSVAIVALPFLTPQEN
ncbi:MAG: hypothetical protein VX436_01760, partial [Planctomycetota bacterium]|nr:hypothetical protein [Planctomycetota bacterium]